VDYFIRINTITATTANTTPIARYQPTGEPYRTAPRGNRMPEG